MAKRSIRGVGIWTDETGGKRGAALKIELDGMTAAVSVGSPDDETGDALPEPDRKQAHYLAIIDERIRAEDYRNSPPLSEWNEKKLRKLGIRL